MKKIVSFVIALAMVFGLTMIWAPQAQAAEKNLIQDAKGENLIELGKILVETSPQGFHPSDGNFIKIKFAHPEEAYYYDIDYTVNIYNNAIKKSIFRRVIKGEDTPNYVSVIWNGMASAGNKAGFDPTQYVPAGKYTVLVCAYGTTLEGETVKLAQRKKTINVTPDAPAGAAGWEAATKYPIYSNDDFTNYMVAKMCEKAGVNINMSEPEKAKMLYKWEVENFTHMHDMPEGEPIWNPELLEAEIEAFARQTDQEVKEGRAMKVYYDTFDIFLAYQTGVCDFNAAAFKALLNQVGIDAGLCGGNYLNRSGTKSPHTWNNAIINGVLKFYDVDVQIQNLGKVDIYYWFDKTHAQSDENHEYSYEEIILF